MPSTETFYCPLRFLNFTEPEQWLCEGRQCGWYDGRMHCCGVFSLVVMSKVFAKIDKENKARDPYDAYTKQG